MDLPVWNLRTGKHMESCNFKHPAPVQCVRINSTTVYSSCDRGLVKVWDLDTTSLLRVTTALNIVHRVPWLVPAALTHRLFRSPR